MTGLLRSKGIFVSEQRVGKSLAQVCPVYHQARQTATARQTNPIPYRADYFGQKLHIDQNEKLIVFGVKHVCAVDGCSRMIVGFHTMSIKNNMEIYRGLYRLANCLAICSVCYIVCICVCILYLLYFAWEDQRQKQYFIIML